MEDVPMRLEAGALFNHEYGIYKVTGFKGEDVMCNRLVNSVVFSKFDEKLEAYDEPNPETFKRAVYIIKMIKLTDIGLSVKLAEWIENGSTIKLKSILELCPFYDDTKLTDFNAFALLDSAR